MAYALVAYSIPYDRSTDTCYPAHEYQEVSTGAVVTPKRVPGTSQLTLPTSVEPPPVGNIERMFILKVNKITLRDILHLSTENLGDFPRGVSSW